MATSYRMRMYRRRAFQQRYLIGIIAYLVITGLVVLVAVNL
jgi:hypothetical protein